MTLGPAISKGTQTAPGRVRSCVVVASPWPLHNPNRPSRRRPHSSFLPSNLVTRALFRSLVPHATRIVPTPIFLSGFTYSVVLYVYRLHGTSESRPVLLSMAWSGCNYAVIHPRTTYIVGPARVWGRGRNKLRRWLTTVVGTSCEGPAALTLSLLIFVRLYSTHAVR